MNEDAAYILQSNETLRIMTGYTKEEHDKYTKEIDAMFENGKQVYILQKEHIEYLIHCGIAMLVWNEAIDDVFYRFNKRKTTTCSS